MSIEVILDNYGGACYPGQTIAGRVECTFNKEKNLRAVRIKFKGRAETEWYESESYYDHSSKKHKTRRVRYSAEEVYFDAEYALVQGGENFVLPAGRHSYPFSYILPPQLPSSFEGTHGFVRYSIKGTVDRPWKFDYEAKIALNLVSPLDLNYIPGLREPIALSVDKHLCCCWCKSGPLTFDISVPTTGFCPEQDVNVGACVQNLSNVSVENVIFKIYKHVEFISHFPSTHHRYDKVLIAECCESGIGAHGEHSWTSTLKIPSNIVYPNLIPCSIINVSYELKAKAVLPCPHTNLSTELPITIGSVPLSGVQLACGPLGPPPTEVPLPSYNQVPSPVAPYPPGPAVSQPTAPPGASAPLLQFTDNHTYPSEKPPLDGLPYPSNAQPPYPPVGAPYSPTVSYPQPTSTFPQPVAPYPPASTGGPYPPASTGGPYPPASTGGPYPPAGTGGPYPPAGTGGPYSSAGTGGPYLPASTGGPYPSGPPAPYNATAPFSNEPMAPPSYDESMRKSQN